MIVTYTSGSGWPRQSMAREQAVRREGGYRWNRGSRPSTGTATAPPQCSIPSWRQGDVDRISKVRALRRDLGRIITPSTATRRRLVVLYFGCA